ncbi:MAG: tRNA lysidine(34) synthetase TilS [Colwellia sp.]
MNPIESALISAINKYPEIPLIIAYSGGVDSQVLLHAFSQLKQKNRLNNALTVCHVNHGLSDNAQSWQAFAQQQCQQVNLPLNICQVKIQAQAQQSLEALARDARYQALKNISAEPSIIVTGHHSDDQAETFLLALKRGSGLKGLSAMAFETKQGKDLLVRPLLNVSRADIVFYAKENGLTWIEDESNQDTSFDRNFIRQQIMPILNQRWSGITRTINRSSDHCREGQLLLNELAVEDLSLCLDKDNRLAISVLNKLSIARFNNLIRYFLAQSDCLMPSTEQLAQLHQQLTAKDDKNPAVKVGEHYLRRYKNLLYLTPDFNDISAKRLVINLTDDYLTDDYLTGDYLIETELTKNNVIIELPDYLGQVQVSKNESENLAVQHSLINKKRVNKKLMIVAPKLTQTASICFSHNNPKCLPDYRQHSRRLKKVLQELNIPPWQRKRIPFLYYDNVFVAAIGYFVCQEFTVK